MLASMEVQLDPRDVPPDVMDALKKMDAAKDSQTSVALSLTDLMVISQALGMLQHAIKGAIRSHGAEMPEAMIDMLGDAKALEGRFDGLCKGIFEREFGADFDMDGMLAKVNEIVGKRHSDERPEKADKPGFGFGSTTYL